VTVLSERRKIPPYGCFGGGPGAVGKNLIIRKEKIETIGGKFSVFLKKGDRLRIETPGGGGYGRSEL
jgi:N-methylhydantoinase B